MLKSLGEVSGRPRSDKDIIEARNAVVKSLINLKDVSPILVHYPTIIEALNELLDRRKMEELKDE
jgi:hypothetical protein